MVESSLVIVGTGRVALSLGRALREHGAPVRAIAGRNRARTRAAAEFIGGVDALEIQAVPSLTRRVLIAVSDVAIADIAKQLATAGFAGVALHTAGSRGPEELAALRERGVACGTLHPLQTFPAGEAGATALAGAYFAVSGDAAAVRWGEEIAAMLGGHLLKIPSQHWALYHSAAVMASNYQITLFDAALEILERAGVPPEQGRAALAPIARATLENVLKLGPLTALTGPISRGDAATVRKNIESLTAVTPETRGLYLAAARRTLTLARQRGVLEEALREIEKIL